MIPVSLQLFSVFLTSPGWGHGLLLEEAYSLSLEQGCCAQFPWSDGISLPTKGWARSPLKRIQFPTHDFLLIQTSGCEPGDGPQEASALPMSPGALGLVRNAAQDHRPLFTPTI